jgi:hypothetical protein
MTPIVTNVVAQTRSIAAQPASALIKLGSDNLALAATTVSPVIAEATVCVGLRLAARVRMTTVTSALATQVPVGPGARTIARTQASVSVRLAVPN